jgi:hypothetical protein
VAGPGSQTPWSCVAGSPDGRGADRLATDLSAELGRDTTPAHVSLLVEERLQPVGTTAPDDAATEDADGPLPPVLSDPLPWCASG